MVRNKITEMGRKIFLVLGGFLAEYHERPLRILSKGKWYCRKGILLFVWRINGKSAVKETVRRLQNILKEAMVSWRK